MQLIYLAYIIPIFGIVLIALFVYLRQRNTSTYAFVGLFSIVALWLFSQMFSALQESQAVVLWSLRFGSMIFNFLPPLLIIFSYYFVHPHKKFPRAWLSLLAPITIGFSIGALGSAIISSAEVNTSQYGPIIHAGPLYLAQTLYLVGGVLIGLLVLFRALSRASRAQRISIYFIILAFSIPLVTNFLVGYIFVSSPALQLFGPLSFFIMEALMGYTIIRHGLFNVRAFVIRAVIYTVLVVTLSTVYILVVFNLGTNLFDRLQLTRYVKVLYIIATFVVALSAQPLKRLFDKITSKLFYQDFYDSQELLDSFSSLIVSTIDRNRLLDGTIELFEKYIRSLNTEVMLLQNAKPELYTHEVKKGAKYNELCEYLLLRRPTIILRDELDETAYSRKTLELFDQAGVSVVVRIQTSKELLGFLLLGPKRSGSMYTNQDSAVLRLVSDELAVALQNALRFREIQNFNETLQQKVNEATYKLREANKKLRALDEVKDEFISMASHQLRTPLTSVKGYISMVLDGDGGSLKREQRKLLGEAFNSAQRMVYLISDFLNVSRIHTGKFVIERRPVLLSELIQTEINQLQASAEAKGLDLVYHAPTHFPTLILDADKTRQVIMNFIDNAIYYTPSGGTITVELTAGAKEVSLKVHDTGIGVPKAERHHLFTKFFRATNARNMRPDGTGIGLFLAKKVVASQGGALIFDSEVGKGSTFGFVFPRNHMNEVSE
jgi:signal transduction histidine kinase